MQTHPKTKLQRITTQIILKRPIQV